jgi:hydrogenase maturation factor
MVAGGDSVGTTIGGTVGTKRESEIKLSFMLRFPDFAGRVGKVVAGHPGLVVLRTAIGGSRIVDQLPGDQLPRIC